MRLKRCKCSERCSEEVFGKAVVALVPIVSALFW
jgi:hypothetical protein